MRSALAVGLALLTLSAACSGGYDNSTGPARAVGSVVVTATSADVLTSIGDTRTLTAVLKDDGGYSIAPPNIAWRTSDASVATVAGAGATATVTTVGNGTAIIFAASGGAEGSVGVTVRQRVASITLTAPDSDLVVGASTQLAVVGLDERGHPTPALPNPLYVSGNTSSVVVSAQGVVTAILSTIAPFSSIVTATMTRDGVELTASKTFRVISAGRAQ
jgi:uncharacterized protein YjdB